MTITVAGNTVTNFFNVQFQKSIAELGQSGISVSTLSFDIVAPFSAATAARVTCDAVPSIDFYINTRTKNGSIYHIECLDAAAFLDQIIQLSNQDINVVTTGTPPNVTIVGKFVSAATIANKVKANCKGLDPSVPWTPTEYGFPLDMIEGKTFQQILTEISEVCAGFYTVITGNILTLKYLNEMDSVSGRPSHTITYHSAVNVNSSFAYDAIDVVSSYQTSTIGSTGATDYNTLTISNAMSDFVFPTYDAYSAEKGHYIYVDTSTTPDELVGIVSVSFEGWSVDSAVLNSVPVLGDYAVFQTLEELRITDVSIRWVGNTMLASLGGGIPSAGEISRRSRRQIEMDNKMTLGSTYGPWRPNGYQVFLLEQESATQGGNS